MAKKIRTLSQYLKSARVKAGLSQREVSVKLGYSSPQFVSNWERGISTPPCRTIKYLAELYRVSAEDMYDVLVADTLRRVEQDLRREFYGSGSVRD